MPAGSRRCRKSVLRPVAIERQLLLGHHERLLGGLPPKQQAAIRATKIEGLSISEAAEAAGISQSDAKMSVYRGLSRLAARVEGKGR